MGRVITVVLLFVIAIAALGFYLDWWSVRKTSHGNEVDITLSVDKNKIKKDTGAVVDKARQTGRAAQEEVRKLAGRDTVRGKIASVDRDEGTITVARDKGENVVVHTNASTTMKRVDETVSLRDLQPDEPVTVAYTTQDGKNIATSVTIEKK